MNQEPARVARSDSVEAKQLAEATASSLLDGASEQTHTFMVSGLTSNSTQRAPLTRATVAELRSFAGTLPQRQPILAEAGINGLMHSIRSGQSSWRRKAAQTTVEVETGVYEVKSGKGRICSSHCMDTATYRRILALDLAVDEMTRCARPSDRQSEVQSLEP